MRRDFIVGSVAILLVVVGIVAYIALSPAGSVKTPTDNLTGRYDEHAPYYDIEAQFATSTPLRESAGTKADTAAVALMKGFVDETVKQFKDDGNFASLTAEDIETMGLGPDRKQDLQIHYFGSSSQQTVSYIFEIYSYTLGAHGNTSYRTFTFDLKSGSLLKLADVFVPDAPYLDRLSTISREKLPKLIEDGFLNQDFIIAGTAPVEASFENFFLDGTSFVLIFPPYAVAPYVAGTQTLAIPVSELEAILKPEYQ